MSRVSQKLSLRRPSASGNRRQLLVEADLEQFFDPDLDDLTRGWLTKALEPAFSQWFDAAYAELRTRLRKYPSQKHAASLESAGLIAENISYLCLMACDSDKAEPTTCAGILVVRLHFRTPIS
jgi:hypothetical protein